jgi:hypothetical protein
MAGLIGGVNRALDVESLHQLDGLAELGCNYCSQNIIDRRKTSLHCRGKVAGEKEAEWEVVFACGR